MDERTSSWHLSNLGSSDIFQNHERANLPFSKMLLNLNLLAKAEEGQQQRS
jgi:hypothetical protein